LLSLVDPGGDVWSRRAGTALQVLFHGRRSYVGSSRAYGLRPSVGLAVRRFLLARDGVRGRVRPGELASTGDAFGGISGSAALLELRCPGRTDSLLERREVLLVGRLG
jgi:hypothetical protein